MANSPMLTDEQIKDIVIAFAGDTEATCSEVRLRTLCIAQAQALIADIDMELMDFISAVILFTDSGELRKMAFEFKTYWQHYRRS